MVLEPRSTRVIATCVKTTVENKAGCNPAMV